VQRIVCTITADFFWSLLVASMNELEGGELRLTKSSDISFRLRLRKVIGLR
jgi:hypothetical protein